MYRKALVSVSNLNLICVRNMGKVRLPKVDKKLQAAAESLASRGFLRPYKPYEPSPNIEETVQKICLDHGLKAESDFDSLDLKFKVLNQCFEETGHAVPNSLLHSIECVDDLKQFYSTPVETSTPFDALKKMELPKNMHVQGDYVRFHPDTDTLFNGKSAFPKSSTIVTGLKSRKKYEGYSAKRSWP